MIVDARLADLLLRWEQLRAEGQSVTPEELCRDCPELVEDLIRTKQARGDAVLDWPAAVQRVGGRTELLREMVHLFLKECDKRLPEIREANRTGDALPLRRAAHSLKGSADWFGAHVAVAAALRLDMMGKEGCLTDADEALAVLEHEIGRLKLALAAYAK